MSKNLNIIYMMAQSKTRRVKTPIHKIGDKFEDTKRPVQCEMPMPELVRSPPEPEPEPEPVPEPSPEPIETKTKTKKSNAWIGFVKSVAQSKNMKYRDALRDPTIKDEYKKFKENKAIIKKN
jgi:hypothetical protein